MTLSDAVTTYSLLSIGDGLVAQIPALLISVGAGFIVTRVSNDESNLGQKMMSELASQPTVLAICAILSLSIGLLPGFPFAAFAFLSVVLYAAYLYRRMFGVSASSGAGQSVGGDATHGPAAAHGGPTDGELMPVKVRLSREARDRPELADLGTRLQRAIFASLGIQLPTIGVEFADMPASHHVTVLFHEMPAATIGVAFGHCLVPEVDSAAHAAGLGCIQLDDPDPACPSLSGTGWWIAQAQRTRAVELGYSAVDALDVMAERVVRLTARNIQELFGVQETKHVLDTVERTHPELLKEAYRHLPLIRITEIFQRLVAECVPIRNARLVLEAIALWAPREKDALVLAEHVRASLAKTISACFLANRAKQIILVAPDSEERIRAAIRQVSAGSFLQMAPEDSQAFIEAVEGRISELNLHRVSSAVLLCAVDVRRFVKKLIERRFPDLDVLSFAEVADSVHIEIATSV
jgi:type III secretion protein V